MKHTRILLIILCLVLVACNNSTPKTATSGQKSAHEKTKSQTPSNKDNNSLPEKLSGGWVYPNGKYFKPDSAHIKFCFMFKKTPDVWTNSMFPHSSPTHLDDNQSVEHEFADMRYSVNMWDVKYVPPEGVSSGVPEKAVHFEEVEECPEQNIVTNEAEKYIIRFYPDKNLVNYTDPSGKLKTSYSSCIREDKTCRAGTKNKVPVDLKSMSIGLPSSSDTTDISYDAIYRGASNELAYLGYDSKNRDLLEASFKAAIAHEIGHHLGFTHPFEGTCDGCKNVLPRQRWDGQKRRDGTQNSWANTSIMMYKENWIDAPAEARDSLFQLSQADKDAEEQVYGYKHYFDNDIITKFTFGNKDAPNINMLVTYEGNTIPPSNYIIPTNTYLRKPNFKAPFLSNSPIYDLLKPDCPVINFKFGGAARIPAGNFETDNNGDAYNFNFRDGSVVANLINWQEGYYMSPVPHTVNIPDISANTYLNVYHLNPSENPYLGIAFSPNPFGGPPPSNS